MLARTPSSLVYLSAEELGITERERAGLIEVRDDLASGRVKHVIPDVLIVGVRDPEARLFNMIEYDLQTDCGTSHCIAGFMRARGVWDKASGPPVLNWSDGLYQLFIPNCDRSHRDMTVAQDVRAIEHFLSGAGPECWPMALQDIPVA